MDVSLALCAHRDIGDLAAHSLFQILHIIAGLLGQRLWFYGKTARYSDGPKFSGACVGCGLCERVCPMRNLSMQNGRPLPRGRCTMCYRCISLCPRKAITLLGKEVTEQCRIENYLSNEKEDAE